MEPQSKSEFVDRLATAVARMRSGVDPVDYNPASSMADNRNGKAKGHASDLEIFLPDPSHSAWIDNPVVRSIEWLSGLEADAPLTLEHIVSVERAWEYFDKMFLRANPFDYGRC